MASSSAGTGPTFSVIGASEVQEAEFEEAIRQELQLSDEKVRSGTSYEEKFQGPHKWRRQLRHVPSKRSKNNRQSNKDTPDYSDEDGTGRTVSLRHNKEHFDSSTVTAAPNRKDRTNDR